MLLNELAIGHRVGLSMLEELIKREADVFGDLTEQDWGNVSTLMKRHRCAATGGIAELLMRAALADFGEAKFGEDGDYFAGFEDGNIAHGSSDGDVLNPNKFGLQYGFAVFEKHCNNIVQVAVHFIQCFPLGMGAGKTRNEADEQAGLRASLNYR